MRWLLDWIKWWWWCLFGPDDLVQTRRVNLSRYAKREMMRQCNLSSRQWRKFKKHMQREAKEEMKNA